MKLDRYVMDMEANGLLEEVSKIHCMVLYDITKKEYITLRTYEEMRAFLEREDTILIGHNIVEYDIPALELVLGVKCRASRLIDTLPLAQHLDPDRMKHGLEYYGEEYGVPKPVVTDWDNLSQDEYIHRCTEDVKINTILYSRQIARLQHLYNNDNKMIDKWLTYTTFKRECLREQYNNPVALNVDLVFDELFRLRDITAEKREDLESVMPQVVKRGMKKKPSTLYKKDGTLSVAGEKWHTLLLEQGFLESEWDQVEEVEVVTSIEPPNANSHDQLKDWLFSLGWVPTTFKFDKNKKTGEVKQIPQIAQKDDKTKLCKSIDKLAEKIPEVAKLAGYSTVRHRVTVLEGFIKNSNGDRLVGGASGLTNTMRLKHSNIVNLPKPHAPFAERIRECLCAPEGYYMVGADLSGIEDKTKQHYIFPLDPEYVSKMNNADFDAHCAIAVLAGLMTEEESDFFKMVDKSEDREGEFTSEQLANYKRLKLIRGDAKQVNFSATYGVGAPTLARNAGFTEKFAKMLIETYWNLNWSVKKFAEGCETRTIGTQMWVKQPVSGFWYSLRTVKDIFSTVNQGTAVYVFDRWVYYLRQAGIKISFQYHDEVCFLVPNDIPEDRIRAIVQESMDKVNAELQLNITVGCSLDFGQDYKQVH